MEQADNLIDETFVNPWDNRQELGFLNALVETIKIVLTKPDYFFANLKVQNSLTSPFLFIAATVIPVSILSEFIMRFIIKTPVPKINFLMMMAMIVVGIAFSFLGAGILHLVAKMFGGKGNYKATYTVTAYASAPMFLGIVPFAGSIVASIWSLVLGIKGFKYVHQFSKARAMMSYLFLPAVFLVIMLVSTVFVSTKYRSKGKLRTQPSVNMMAPVQGNSVLPTNSVVSK